MFLGPPKKTTPPTKKKKKTLTPEEHAAQTARLTSALAPWLEKHGVPYWRPIVDDTATAEEHGHSWFGGGALLADDVAWPDCAQCKKPMHHFLQLDLSTLPDGASPQKQGLVSFFYCSTDDGNCEVWDPKSGAHAFVLSPSDESCSLRPSPLQKPMKWQIISSFTHHRDPPPEHKGVRFDRSAGADGRGDVVDDDGAFIASDVDDGVFYEICAPAAGDKLGGSPYELQGPQGLPCPVCQKEMRQLFQIDSNDNLDYMFGDSGCAHIVQCDAHPSQLAFWWDCC